MLGSAGSASELFLRQVRSGVPLTVTDTGMIRYWITMGHAACLASHAALLAADGAMLAAPADPVALNVGQLASRIWEAAGGEGNPEIEALGIRPGETMTEVLIGPSEELGGEIHQGIAPIRAEIPTAAAAWVHERLTDDSARAAATTGVWMEAMSRLGLLEPSAPTQP